jgi:hypothetical protein
MHKRHLNITYVEKKILIDHYIDMTSSKTLMALFELSGEKNYLIRKT